MMKTLDCVTQNLNFSVIIPTVGTRPNIHETIQKVLACSPGPSEVLIHVDGTDPDGQLQLPVDPRIKVVYSTQSVGPGGGRQRLIKEAKNNWVASFDDDSFPLNSNFFSTAAAVLKLYPQIAVLSGVSNTVTETKPNLRRVSNYEGCGCIFVKEWFNKIPGFLPLPCSYGMEEVDVSLQLHDVGGLIIEDSELKTVHKRFPNPQFDSTIGPEAMSNNVLFCYIRFPLACLPVGLWKVVSYGRWLFKQQGIRAVIEGLRLTIEKLKSFRASRHPVRIISYLSWTALSYKPQVLSVD